MKVAFIDIDHSISNAYWRDGMTNQGSWDDYHEAAAKDQPIMETIEMINSLHKDSWTIIGVTGRPERFRQLTTLWLVEKYVMIDKLVMRADDDYRPTPEFKIEAIHNEILQLQLNSLVVAMDDRDDVIAALKSTPLGPMIILQVHTGGSNNETTEAKKA